MPIEIDQLERSITQFEMERQALEKKGDKTPDVTAQTHEGGVFTVGGLAAGEFILVRSATPDNTPERSWVVVRPQQLNRLFFDRLTVNWHWRLIGLL